MPPPPPSVDPSLPDEAMEPSKLLEELMMKAREQNAQGAPGSNVQTGRRPVGRPRGSRTATSSASSTRVPPPGNARRVAPPPPPVNPDAPTAEERAAAIGARTSELQEKIAEGINETIMLGLTSIGIPVALLYKPGQEPAMAMESEKYTDLAKGMLVSPNQARFWARFAAEMEQTERGKSLTAATGSGNAPLFIYGALSLLTGVQYIQTATNTLRNLKPYLDQYQAAQAEFAQRSAEMKANAEQQAVNGQN